MHLSHFLDLQDSRELEQLLKHQELISKIGLEKE
jgi:hypothetical protein